MVVNEADKDKDKKVSEEIRDMYRNLGRKLRKEFLESV